MTIYNNNLLYYIRLDLLCVVDCLLGLYTISCIQLSNITQSYTRYGICSRDNKIRETVAVSLNPESPRFSGLCDTGILVSLATSIYNMLWLVICAHTIYSSITSHNNSYVNYGNDPVPPPTNSFIKYSNVPQVYRTNFIFRWLSC